MQVPRGIDHALGRVASLMSRAALSARANPLCTCHSLTRLPPHLPAYSYGFVVFQDPAVTDIAIAGLHGLKMGDRTLTVRRAAEVRWGSVCGRRCEALSTGDRHWPQTLSYPCTPAAGDASALCQGMHCLSDQAHTLTIPIFALAMFAGCSRGSGSRRALRHLPGGPDDGGGNGGSGGGSRQRRDRAWPDNVGTRYSRRLARGGAVRRRDIRGDH